LYKNTLRLPYPLPKGYWLENQGIGPDVAFLDYTYEQYAAFSAAPPISTLKQKIREANPLLEMWDCGLRDTFSHLTTDVTNLVLKGFPACTPLIH
jgi:C-terminal processing protease CtpA/Prc